MSSHQNLEARYDALCDEFFDTFYTYHPSHATRQGFHEYDNHLGHYHRDEIEETLRKLKAVQAQLAQIDPRSMDHLHALDHPVLTTRMNREIYWIESWRHWEYNPLFYKWAITDATFNLVSRSFAPLEERLKSLIAREQDIPNVLRAARENLVNPPPELTEQAIRLFNGAKTFFGNILGEFASVQDSRLQSQFREANTRALDEIDQFVSFLQNDLMPRSHGNFAVGEAAFNAILDCEEMIDVPVRDILARCYADLAAVDAEILEAAKQVDPHKTPEELRAQMQTNHATKDELLPAMKKQLAHMRAALSERNIMTLPPELPEVIITPLPSYFSSGAMMMTPGPFEHKAKEAFLVLNIPQPGWSEERTQAALRNFNHHSMTTLFLHEAYPGHHVQFYLEKRVPMRASKDHDSDSNSDGWADYGKYMMMEQVYIPMDPLYKLSSLQGKKGTIIRSIVGMELHLQLKTPAQAIDWMASASGRAREAAGMGLDRVMYYPTHLTYYIGSEMMRKLRDDYRKVQGANFTLKEFHDRFMTYGLIPIKVIRQDMLAGADDGVLF